MSWIFYVLAGIISMKWIFSGGEYFYAIVFFLVLGWVFDV